MSLLVAPVRAEFGVSLEQVMYSLTSATFLGLFVQPLGGFLIDRYSVRIIMITGTLLCALGLYALAASTSITQIHSGICFDDVCLQLCGPYEQFRGYLPVVFQQSRSCPWHCSHGHLSWWCSHTCLDQSLAGRRGLAGCSPKPVVLHPVNYAACRHPDHKVKTRRPGSIGRGRQSSRLSKHRATTKILI